MKNSLTRQTLVVAISTLMLTACFGNSAEQYLAAAKTEISKNDSGAAIIQLKNALQKNPSLAEARLLLGTLLLKTGDSVGALVELNKAKDLGSPADGVTPLIAKAMVNLGQSDQVLSSFSTTQLLDASANADLRSSVAAAYMSKGKYAEANKELDAALVAKPNSRDAQLQKIKLLMRQREFSAADEALGKILAAAPDTVEAWQLKGDVLLDEGGHSDEAIASYKQALKLDRRCVPAHVALLWTYLGRKDIPAFEAQLAALKSALPKNPQILLFEGLLALEKGDLKVAYERSQALLKVAPEHIRALQLAGMVELQRGDLLLAINHFQKIQSLAPDYVPTRLQLAQAYLRSGDADKALTTLQPLLVDSSKLAAAFSFAAQASLQLGDSAKAETYFKKAAELNPKDTKSRAALALAEVAKGQDARGFEDLRVLAAADEGGEMDLALISAYMNKREWDAALKAIDALEKKRPKQATAADLRGRVELARGNRDAARQAFEAANKIDPSFYPAVSSLAALDRTDSGPDAALKRFQAFLAVSPANMRAKMAIIGLKMEAGASETEMITALGKLVEDNPGEIAPRVTLIQYELDHKNVKKALDAAQNAMSALPDRVELMDLLARAQLADGQTNQALASVGQWASLQPESSAPMIRMAEIQLAQNDRAGAMQSLKKALAMKGDRLAIQRIMIQVEMSAGHVAEVRGIIKNVQTERPKDGIGYLLEGDLELALKNLPAALAAFKKSMDTQPSTAVAIRLHRTYVAMGKTAEAQQFAAQWQKQHPTDAAFVFYAGDLALSSGQFDIAERMYRQILELQPTNPLAMNNVAWLMNRSKNPAALGFAEKAVKIQPNEAAFLDTLADVLQTQGQFDRAIAVQKQAVDMSPELYTNRLHLAKIYLAAGKRSQAKDELTILQKLANKYPNQEEVRKLLSST